MIIDETFLLHIIFNDNGLGKIPCMDEMEIWEWVSTKMSSSWRYQSLYHALQKYTWYW